MYWNKLNTMLLILIISAGIITPGIAEAGLILSVQPDSSSVEVSSEFEINFYAGDDTVDLMGYRVVFSYDPGHLDVVSVNEGSLPSGSGEETFFHCNSALSDTTAEVNGAILGAVVQTPGYLFTVTFKALKAGKTYLEIVESDLRDDSNNQISHGIDGGVVVITEEIAVEEASWGYIKSQYK